MRTALLTILGIAAIAAGAGADWPTVAHDNARSGRTPDVVGDGTIREVWFRTFADNQIATATAPIIAGGIVYIGGYSGEFYALRLEDGADMWKAQLGGPIVHSAAAENGIVYVPCMDGRLYALDAKTGRTIWTFQADAGFSAAPCVERGIVYIGGRDGHFRAIRDGRQLWSLAAPAPFRLTAAMRDGVVYVGSDDMVVHALNAADGRPLWHSRPLAGKNLKDYWPVVTERHVIVRVTPLTRFHSTLGRHDGAYQTCFVLNRADGSEAFVPQVGYTAGCGATGQPPVIGPAGEVYFFAQNPGTPSNAPGIYEMDQRTGATRLVGIVRTPRDETYSISLSGDGGRRIWITHQDMMWYFNLAAGDEGIGFGPASAVTGRRDTVNGHDMVEWSRNAWHGPAQAPAAISGRYVVWQAGGYVMGLSVGR